MISVTGSTRAGIEIAKNAAPSVKRVTQELGGKRTMLYDWLQDFGVSVDWTHGVMGAPFSAGHYSGRAAGDYSATFFGK